MPMSYDNWDDERERLLNALGESERDRVSGLLDRAAHAARANNLRDAAQCLEEMRRELVARNLFRSWDDGILVFASLIRLIRAMSTEQTVPREYQRFLDAIPSLSYEARMTQSQTAFWYRSPDEPLYAGAEGGMGVVVLGALVFCVGVAIVAYWIFG
ncbi:MAG TPA: hypothetical protein VEJ63_14350 [Planctomycetota bacterium]|nr:hypothetical protein [Planctomycetota bacterium]